MCIVLLFMSLEDLSVVSILQYKNIFKMRYYIPHLPEQHEGQVKEHALSK